MLANGDGAKPIWVTEMSWATGGPPHPFVTTEAYQALKLRRAWDTLLACRGRWDLQRVYWFGWKDRAVPAGGTDYWGYHNGLLRLDGTAKPALAASDEYVDNVPLPDGRGDTCPLPGGDVIDTTPPETTIADGPGARTASTTPTFRFTSNEAGVRFQCHLEGLGWSECPVDGTGTWKPSSAMGQGTHTLYVRAIDPTGNADGSPAARGFIVDLTPPDTYVSGTWGNVTSPIPPLTLSANEPVARYECRIDSGTWTTCTSPYSTSMPLGAHTLSVRAVDLAGWADPNPAGPWYQVR
jgi:hypothetical protein